VFFARRMRSPFRGRSGPETCASPPRARRAIKRSDCAAVTGLLVDKRARRRRSKVPARRVWLSLTLAGIRLLRRVEQQKRSQDRRRVPPLIEKAGTWRHKSLFVAAGRSLAPAPEAQLWARIRRAAPGRRVEAGLVSLHEFASTAWHAPAANDGAMAHFSRRLPSFEQAGSIYVLVAQRRSRASRAYGRARARTRRCGRTRAPAVARHSYRWLASSTLSARRGMLESITTSRRFPGPVLVGSPQR